LSGLKALPIDWFRLVGEEELLKVLVLVVEVGVTFMLDLDPEKFISLA